jgi:hypothetical protein
MGIALAIHGSQALTHYLCLTDATFCIATLTVSQKGLGNPADYVDRFTEEAPEVYTEDPRLTFA